jgi:ribulose-phosphate 3-epimerase
MSTHIREVKLAPSLIAADWWRIGEQVTQLGEAGVEWLHFDAMDGYFVPNLTLGPMFVEALRPHSQLHFDAHLMLRNAGEMIEPFLKAGANSISVHVEENAHLHRLIHRIKDGGALAGVVLNPATPVSSLEVVLPDVDFVLVMSVNPGFSGQKFIPSALQKIAQLKQMREQRNLKFLIQVDGGVAPETAPDIVRAGADVLVVGSAMFHPGRSLAQSVQQMRDAVTEALKP